MVRHRHHFKIAFMLAIAAGSWGVYWLPQRYLENGGLTGGWGTISQMMIGILLLTPISLWRKFKGRSSGLEIPFVGFLTGSGFICYALSFLLTDVVRALIMFYMIPVWTTIFEIIFLKKRPGLERVLTLGLALGGLWIVFSKSNIEQLLLIIKVIEIYNTNMSESVQEPNYGLAFLLVIIAGLSTTFGAVAVMFDKCVQLTDKRFLASSLALSAGVMIYVSFVEIFVKSVEAFQEQKLSFTRNNTPSKPHASILKTRNCGADHNFNAR